MKCFEGNHNEDSPECWCRPNLKKLCAECDGERCQLCDFSGLVEASVSDVEIAEVPFLIIHKFDDNQEADPSYLEAVDQAVEMMKNTN